MFLLPRPATTAWLRAGISHRSWSLCQGHTAAWMARGLTKGIRGQDWRGLNRLDRWAAFPTMCHGEGDIRDPEMLLEAELDDSMGGHFQLLERSTLLGMGVAQGMGVP